MFHFTVVLLQGLFLPLESQQDGISLWRLLYVLQESLEEKLSKAPKACLQTPSEPLALRTTLLCFALPCSELGIPVLHHPLGISMDCA